MLSTKFLLAPRDLVTNNQSLGWEPLGSWPLIQRIKIYKLIYTKSEIQVRNTLSIVTPGHRKVLKGLDNCLGLPFMQLRRRSLVAKG